MFEVGSQRIITMSHYIPSPAHRHSGRRYPVSCRRHSGKSSRRHTLGLYTRSISDLRRQLRHPGAHYTKRTYRIHRTGRDGRRSLLGVRADADGITNPRRGLRDARLTPSTTARTIRRRSYTGGSCSKPAQRRSMWSQRRRRRCQYRMASGVVSQSMESRWSLEQIRCSMHGQSALEDGS